MHSFQSWLVRSDWQEKVQNWGKDLKTIFVSTPNVAEKAAVAKPFSRVRYDLHDHYPDFTEKRGRCCFCPNGYSNRYFRKCNMVFCLQKVTVFICFIIN